jgi:hypothetical protein
VKKNNTQVNKIKMDAKILRIIFLGILLFDKVVSMAFVFIS